MNHSSSTPHGVVVKLQRYSIQDGPGIRTTVFFKGCPLKCSWCCSPETQNNHPEIMFQAEKCLPECQICTEICPPQAISIQSTQVRLDRGKCTNCGDCESVCPSQALMMAGQSMSIDDVLTEVKKDRQFYRNSGGGVTLSGGEPLIQADFAVALAKQCQESRIHVVLDTCGHTSHTAFKNILPFLDLVYLDIKFAAPDKHLKYTGLSNEKILKNAALIKESGVPFAIRFPLIPGINDAIEDLQSLAKLVKQLAPGQGLHVLPFHSLGTVKYQMLDKSYDLADVQIPDKKQINNVVKIFEDHGLKTTLIN